MDNLWIVTGDPQARWTADLGSPDDPERLLAWLAAVLTAGEEHEVYRVREAPAAGYAAGSDVSLTDWLWRRWREDGVVDAGHFAASGTRPIGGRVLRVAARVAWAAPSGELAEGVVENLGALLRSLRPGDVARWPRRMLDSPPLDVTGPLVDVRRPEQSRWPGHPGRVLVNIMTRSDLWSPWVPGLLATDVVDGWQDNRPLAERHTPRLNAFLAAARAATAAAGGTWWTDDDTVLGKLGLLGDDGIRLDAANPSPPDPR